MEIKEEATDEGYRLAPFLLRLAASSIDAAIALLAVVMMYFACFPNGAFKTLGDAMGVPSQYSTLQKYQEASGLVVASSDGSLSDISSSSYEEYQSAIQYYYFIYNAADSTVNPSPEKYSFMDYNVAVLDLPSDVKNANHSDYFDFAAANGEPDSSQLGVLKSSLYGSDDKLTEGSRSLLLTFFQGKYAATQDLMISESYYKTAEEAYSSNVEILESIVVFIPFLGFYFAIPMFSPFGRTLGKKWMKLAVIDVDGVPLRKWLLILRILSFILTLGAAILLDDAIYSISLLVLVFLISFGLVCFGKKRRALHDYCAHGVVVRDEDAFMKPKAEAPENA
jgi:hypothetical protein